MNLCLNSSNFVVGNPMFLLCSPWIVIVVLADYLSLWPQCYLCQNPERSQIIYGGYANNSKVACSELPLTNGPIKCSNLDNQNSRKRKRLYKWQRLKKQKQIFPSSEDKSLTSQSEISTNGFGVHDVLLEDLCATVKDKSQFLEPTVDNDSLAMNIRTSQCNSTSRIQSTSSQVGLPNFMHLNVSTFSIIS